MRVALMAALTLVGGLAAVATAGPAVAQGERTYELATPYGSNANLRSAGGIASADGNTTCWATEDVQAGSIPNGSGFNDDAFCAWRRSDGWHTEWLSQPQEPGHLGAYGTRVYHLSDDGGRAILGGNTPIKGFPDYEGAPDDPEELPNVNVTPNNSSWLWESGELTWLTPRPLPIEEDHGGTPRGTPLAVNDSLDRVLFQSTRDLVPNDTSSSEAETAVDADVYIGTPGGLELVSIDENGEAIGDANVELHGYVGEPGALSPDGSTAFFQSTRPVHGAPGGGWDQNSVFRWRDGEVELVSPRRGPDGTTVANVRFAGASEDGEVVYLRSEEQLTLDPKLPGDALYRYRIPTDELELVATGPGGVVPLDVSADGSTVFYRVLFSLYADRDGVETLVAPLAPTDLMPQRVASAIEAGQAIRVSDDGSRAIFPSEAQTPGAAQVFLWEAGKGLTRLSEDAAGEPAATSATFGNYADLVVAGTEIADLDQHWQWMNRGRVWTDDYETVFFQTASPLVAGDRNEVSDVYEWRDGELRLVTPGTPGEKGYYYHASSADGSTVFFHTYERVLPGWDRNPVRDVYAARTGGGGFPPPPASDVGVPPAPSGPGVAPGRRGVGSSQARDGGQAKGGDGRSLVVGKLSKRAVRAMARRGRVAVRVRLAEGGRVRVRAVARLGGRRRVVGRSVGRIGPRGRGKVAFGLSRPARRVLRRGRTLKVRVVADAPGVGRDRVTLRLRRPGGKRRGARGAGARRGGADGRSMVKRARG